MSVTVPLTFSPKKETGLVEVAGSYNNWTKVAMTKNPEASGEWSISVNLHPGTHQYKYFVEGEWVVDSECATVDNNLGELNNLIIVAGDLSSEDLEFLVKTTNQNEDELKKYYKLFQLRHTTGNIDKKEYTKMGSAYQNDSVVCSPDLDCIYAFTIFDKNRNGHISFREAAHTLYVNKLDGPEEDKIRMVFRLFDTNQSGTFGKKEFLDFICASVDKKLLGEDGLKEIEEDVMKIIGPLDMNKDGLISEEEFVKGFIEDTGDNGNLKGTYCGLILLQDTMVGVIKQDFENFMYKVPDMKEFDKELADVMLNIKRFM